MPYQIDAAILRNACESNGIYRLRLHAPAIAAHALPGHFVQILYGGAFGPMMRRPFSIHDVVEAEGSFDILYASRGPFTRGMSALSVGGALSVVGPLGNEFALIPDPRLHILAAGGVGAPPLHFFAKTVIHQSPSTRLLVINGARSAEQLVAQDDFEALGVEVHVTTDDGSSGRRGTVLDELRDILHTHTGAAVYACGPEPMLRALAEHCTRTGVPCRVSLETVMPCGTGVCMGCVVKVRSSLEPDGFTYKRACHDGPVFDAQELLWD